MTAVAAGPYAGHINESAQAGPFPLGEWSGVLLCMGGGAMALGFATAERNRQADTFTDELDGGFIDIYSGTRAADANTAIGAQVLLAHIPLSTPSAGSASSGVATFTMPAEDTSADATGTAAWFRAKKSNNSTVVCDGSVTATGGGGDIELVSTSLVSGQPVRITSLTFTAPPA